MRTLSEILKDADKVDNIDELCALDEELRSNYKKYPLVELNYAQERFLLLSTEMAKRHSKHIIGFMDNLLKNKK